MSSLPNRIRVETTGGYVKRQVASFIGSILTAAFIGVVFLVVAFFLLLPVIIYGGGGFIVIVHFIHKFW